MIPTGRIMSFPTAWRSVASLSVALLLLWVLARRQLIETRTLVDAAANAPGTIVLLAILLLLPLVMGSVRYHAVLRTMARRVPMSAIVAANMVSGAVSTWLPASAGFMEVIRFGLVVRSTRGDPDAVSKTDLAVAGLVDRLLGLATVALIGLIGGVYLLLTRDARGRGGTGTIVALTLLSAAGCTLPFVAVRVPRLERAAARLSSVALLGVLQRAMAALRQVNVRSPAFTVALVASLGISATTVLATYLAMRLFAPATPLLAVAVGFPLLTLAALLPGNVGGFGGNQVAAALVFAALALDPKAAVLASLLVSALTLLTTSIAGILWVPTAWQHARAAMPAAAAEPPMSQPGRRARTRD
jgi:uncharacterized membrane protein YbhN (UPF0104 family)